MKISWESNLDPSIPWCVGVSWQASQYMFENRAEAEAMVVSLNAIDRAGWAVRHHDDILEAKRLATEQKAT